MIFILPSKKQLRTIEKGFHRQLVIVTDMLKYFSVGIPSQINLE